MVLRVDGQPARLEAKPLALLHVLLLRGGASVGKDALIEAVWGNPEHTSPASLATAISKIRSALGERGRDIVGVVHGSGYRITVPVEVADMAIGSEPPLALKSGDAIPGRPGWRLAPLPTSHERGLVWLGLQASTGDVHVFKFASTEDGLAALRREAELAGTLRTALGPRDDLVPVLGTQFERTPYFLERPLAGADFLSWSLFCGGLAALPLGQRLALLAGLSRTVAATHAAGVPHGAIKPSNVLIAEQPDGSLGLRLVDFRCGGQEQRHGSLDAGPYAAPERQSGGDITIGTDVYSLGVLLYQMAIGDFGEGLGVGWEVRVQDDLLRQDIALAACADPGKRLASAADLAERLETLAQRRDAQAARLREAAQADALRAIVERNRLRRPWAITAASSLAVGIVLASGFALRAVVDRNAARHQAELSQSVVAFLTTDLLGRGNPAQSGRPDETLMEAAQAAEAEIGQRLSAEPIVAGTLHLAIAQAFESRSAYVSSRSAYEAAVAAFAKAGRAGQPDQVITQLRLAGLEARSGQAGSLERTRGLLARASPSLGILGARQQEGRIWYDAARGLAEMLGGNVQVAGEAFAVAADGAESLPTIFDEATRIGLRRQEALTYLRRGEWARAEHLLLALLPRSLALSGPRHPDTLEIELSLAQTHSGAGRMAEAVTEYDRIEPDFVAVFGPSHQATLDLLSARSGSLSWLGQFKRAIADQTTLVQRVNAREGEYGFFPLAAGIDLAELQCRAGQADAGSELAHTIWLKADSTFGRSSGLAQAISGKLAFCLVLAGHGELARRLLDGINVKRVSEMTSDPVYGAELDLMRAAIDCHSREPRDVTHIAAALDRDDADPYYRQWSRRLVSECVPRG